MYSIPCFVLNISIFSIFLVHDNNIIMNHCCIPDPSINNFPFISSLHITIGLFMIYAQRQWKTKKLMTKEELIALAFNMLHIICLLTMY